MKIWLLLVVALLSIYAVKCQEGSRGIGMGGGGGDDESRMAEPPGDPMTAVSTLSAQWGKAWCWKSKKYAMYRCNNDW